MSRRKYWVAWSDIFIPKKEEGLSFRSLFWHFYSLACQILRSLELRSSCGLSLYRKILQKIWSSSGGMEGGSQMWKYMIYVWSFIDQDIWWELQCCHSNIWYDNWTQNGALHYYLLVAYTEIHTVEIVN